MTLILVTLTSRAAIIVTDRRTIADNHKTDKSTILTDHAEKILVGENIVLAVTGDNKSSKRTGRDAIARWLADEYNLGKSLEEQLRALYTTSFSDGSRGDFVAVSYSNGTAQVARTNRSDGIEFKSVVTAGKGIMKFYGSGNQIAGALVDLAAPPLEAFDIQEVINFSIFIVESTFQVMKYQQADLPSVGPETMVAVVDDKGSHLIRGENYTIAQ